MLEYTEKDKSDEGPPSSSVVERSPAANKTGTADRLVYKLVKVCVPCNVYLKPCTEKFMCSSLADKPHLKSCMCELSALVGALVHGSLANGTHCIIDHDWDRLEMMDQFFQPQKMKFSSRW
jgi:hypothetical protein